MKELSREEFEAICAKPPGTHSPEELAQIMYHYGFALSEMFDDFFNVFGEAENFCRICRFADDCDKSKRDCKYKILGVYLNDEEPWYASCENLGEWCAQKALERAADIAARYDVDIYAPHSTENPKDKPAVLLRDVEQFKALEVDGTHIGDYCLESFTVNENNHWQFRVRKVCGGIIYWLDLLEDDADFEKLNVEIETYREKFRRGLK